jgi:hypothetical protein
VFSSPKRQSGNNFRKTVIPELTGGNTNATMHASGTQSRESKTSPQDWREQMLGVTYYCHGKAKSREFFASIADAQRDAEQYNKQFGPSGWAAAVGYVD